MPLNQSFRVIRERRKVDEIQMSEFHHRGRRLYTATAVTSIDGGRVSNNAYSNAYSESQTIEMTPIVMRRFQHVGWLRLHIYRACEKQPRHL